MKQSDSNTTARRSFKKIGETSFRDLFHKIIYIESTPYLKSLSEKLEVLGDDDGFLAYGYIDDQAGFSFRVLCSAHVKGSALSRGETLNDIHLVIRRGQLNDCNYVDLDSFNVDTSDFDEYINNINSIFVCESEHTEDMRCFEFLDESRNINFPDDIQIFLAKDGFSPERVWGKCWTYTDKELFAKLLNEPNQNFGIHNGDIIGFSPIEFEESIICVYTGRWLDEKK